MKKKYYLFFVLSVMSFQVNASDGSNGCGHRLENYDPKNDNNQQGDLFVYAARERKNNLLERLLDRYGNSILNVKNYKGWTALMTASSNRDGELVQRLLEEEHIDVNAKNNEGDNALILASGGESADIVEMLLNKNGIDVNAKDNEGRNALMECAKHSKFAKNACLVIMQMLLEQEGFDVNAQDNLGNTALMLFSLSGHDQAVRELLKRKDINVNAKNRERRTALDFASDAGIKAMLKEKITEQRNAQQRNSHGRCVIS